jgi:hypothetical protein
MRVVATETSDATSIIQRKNLSIPILPERDPDIFGHTPKRRHRRLCQDVISTYRMFAGHRMAIPANDMRFSSETKLCRVFHGRCHFWNLNMTPQANFFLGLTVIVQLIMCIEGSGVFFYMTLGAKLAQP